MQTTTAPVNGAVVPGLDELSDGESVRALMMPVRPPPPEDVVGVIVRGHDEDRVAMHAEETAVYTALEKAAEQHDDFCMPAGIKFPRLALVSVVEPVRCAVYIRRTILDQLARCLPTISQDLLDELWAHIEISRLRRRYANITLAFWWMATQIESVGHAVVLSEMQYTSREDAEQLLTAMTKFVTTVRQSSFEPFNTWPVIVSSFYFVAFDMIAAQNKELVRGWAQVNVSEKVQPEDKQHGDKDLLKMIASAGLDGYVYDDDDEPAAAADANNTPAKTARVDKQKKSFRIDYQ